MSVWVVVPSLCCISGRKECNFPGAVAEQAQTPQSHRPLPLQTLPSGVRQRRSDDSVDSLHTAPTWLEGGGDMFQP
ncbi:hypothetical protein EYF80_052525 [Liparis tanakae]|uniref:Uncharacterized protein n=1 Tax=Liparis tanakae TaxID=230148 RepID=A0A4Z2F8H1_9TELE|nr:hypothetical protein EYF80_052525 [Liparis tanakae]